MAHLAADLAVTLEDDRPGMLARAISCVSGSGINIDGYAEMNGVVHVLATDLDHTRQCLQGGGFKINNPNAVKSCGCGSSFATEESEGAAPGGGCGCGGSGGGCGSH